MGHGLADRQRGSGLGDAGSGDQLGLEWPGDGGGKPDHGQRGVVELGTAGEHDLAQARRQRAGRIPDRAASSSSA